MRRLLPIDDVEPTRPQVDVPPMRGPQMRRIQPWRFENPVCATIDPELFFIDSKGVYPKAAYDACNVCSHKTDCATYAITIIGLDGLWGGLTPTQRAEARKRQRISGTPIAQEFGLVNR